MMMLMMRRLALSAALLVLLVRVDRSQAADCTALTEEMQTCFATHHAGDADTAFVSCGVCYNTGDLDAQLASGEINQLKYAVEICSIGRNCAAACGECYREMSNLASCSLGCYDNLFHRQRIEPPPPIRGGTARVPDLVLTPSPSTAQPQTRVFRTVMEAFNVTTRSLDWFLGGCSPSNPPFLLLLVRGRQSMEIAQHKE